MQHKTNHPTQRELDTLLRDFGVKPSEEMRKNLQREVESQKEKFLTIERIHGKKSERDLSR